MHTWGHITLHAESGERGMRGAKRGGGLRGLRRGNRKREMGKYLKKENRERVRITRREGGGMFRKLLKRVEEKG
jgi:hypothetical protein